MRNINKISAFVSIFLFAFCLNSSAISNEVTSDSVKYRFSPITVTGQRYSMPLKDAAASITIISPQEISTTNFLNTADIISYMSPGVFTTRRSNMGYGVAVLAGGSISIRGIGGKPNSQVLVLIDGRPDFQGIFSHPLNDAYFTDNIDHIEVMRGPGSAVYGTNALGGVMNIITKKLPQSGFHTKFTAGYGSFNSQKILLQNSGVLGKFRYFLSGGMNKSDSHRENGNFESKNFTAKMGYEINSHFNIEFQGSATPYEFNDPGPENISLNGYFDHGKILRNSLDLTLSNNFATTQGDVKFHANFGHHELSDGWLSDDQTVGIIMFQNFDLPRNFKTTIGIDIKRFGGTAESNGNKLGTYFVDEQAAYFHLQKYLWQRFLLAGGIRAEKNSIFGTELIPKFGATYHPFSRTAIRASVSKGFRTPSIKDLYLFPPANPNLKPERLWNYELGWTQNLTQRVSLDITGFYYKGDQFIETIMIAPGQMQNSNTGKIEAKGFEATLQGNFYENLNANISYSYLKADRDIPFSPNKFNFWLAYNRQKLNIALYGEYITNLFASYQPAGFPPRTVIEKMDDYALIHAKLSYSILKNYRISFAIENLTDEKYEILKGYPMPGRSFSAQLDLNF